MQSRAVAPPPSLGLALIEINRALAELALLPIAAPLLRSMPKGDGHPVLVLPGFTASDKSTAILRRYLDGLGYDTYAWELGRNLGPRAIGHEGEKLVERLAAIHKLTGKKVSLIGWSLGGVMARQVSRRLPHAVRQVITLGSPFASDPRSTNAWRAYEFATGQRIDSEAVRVQLEESREAPPVPSTAIYSRTDGVVAWEGCVEPETATTDNIEVYGSHCGLGVNASVLYAVADRLALPEDGWTPFERSGWRSAVFPEAAVH